jgi:TOBE domain
VYRGCKVETRLGSFAVPDGVGTPQDGVCTVAVYPHKARLAPAVESLSAASQDCLEGRIEAIHDLGLRMQYVVQLGSGDLIEIETSASQADGCMSVQQVGERVLVRIPPEAVRFY